MKIFFDTEFTGLHKNTTLISIGLVDENARTFYAELNDFDRTQVNDWIRDNVIANLKHKDDIEGALFPVKEQGVISGHNSGNGGVGWECFGDKSFVAGHLRRWLGAYDKVQLISDVCHYDMVMFIDLFGDAFSLPDGVNASCHDINQDIASYYGLTEAEAFDKSREEIIRENGGAIAGSKHNSLYDAMVIKEIYRIINR